MGLCILNGRLKFALTARVTIIPQKCQNFLVSAKSKAGIDRRSTQITVIRKVMDMRKDEKKMGGPYEPPKFSEVTS